MSDWDRESIAGGRLEELLDLAWPAHARRAIRGWVAYESGGVSRRANSVRPNGDPGDLDATLAEVEEFYAEHGLPSTIRLTPRSCPADLDAILERRGYAVATPTVVCVAEARAAVKALAAKVTPPHEVAVEDEPGAEWLDFWYAAEGHGQEPERTTALRILTGVPARYVSIRLTGALAERDLAGGGVAGGGVAGGGVAGGGVAGGGVAGGGVAGGGVAGRGGTAGGLAAIGRLTPIEDHALVHSLSVRRDLRGRSMGTALLRALAVDAGHATLGLQVLAANATARSLYATAGFHVAWPYHYRTHS